MATPHLWHQLHLYRTQLSRLTLLGLLALAVPLSAQAQKKSRASASRGKGGQVKSITVDNLPGYDVKWFHPGFYIAPHFSRYKIEQSSAYIANLGSGRGVTANAIAPAYVKTPMITEQLDEEQRQKLLRDIPVGRFCEPEEFAHVVRFLASPLAGFVTGEIIDLNGGLLMD